MNKVYKQQIDKALTSILAKEQLFSKAILVTGASGLIGRAVVKMLSALNDVHNAKIRIVASGRKESSLQELFGDLKGVEYWAFDINKEIESKIEFDYIIHCAAITSSGLFASAPKEVLFDNIFSLKNILDFAIKQNRKSRFLFLSSLEVYGEPYEFQKEFFENDLGYWSLSDTRAIYPYTKRMGELMCASYAKQHNLNFVTVRLSKVFGPDFVQGDTRIGASFLQKAAIGEDLVLNTKGEQKASYCYILDAIAALLSVLAKGESSEIYNASYNGAPVSAFEFATYCANAGGTKVVVKEATKDMGYAKVSHMVQNFDKITALGFKPQYTVKTGVKAGIDALKN